MYLLHAILLDGGSGLIAEGKRSVHAKHRLKASILHSISNNSGDVSMQNDQISRRMLDQHVHDEESEEHLWKSLFSGHYCQSISHANNNNKFAAQNN